MVVDFKMNDIVRLRKTHPCGSFEWQVTRLGADIGLKCQGCGRYVLLPRSELERRGVKLDLDRMREALRKGDERSAGREEGQPHQEE